MNTVDRLVPGVTTVTLNARYYPLHGLVAAKARDRSMGLSAAQDLLRRVEVTIGAVSARHLHVDPGGHAALSRPHGYDIISPRVREGSIDVGALAAPHVYAQPSWGFWSAYRGSEMVLRIVTRTNDIAPGDQLDVNAVSEGLEDVFGLAAQSTLDTASLDNHAHLCICRSTSSLDGAWLANLFAAPYADRPTTRAGIRRQTLRMIARSIQLTNIEFVTRDLAPFLAYHDEAIEDEVLASMEITAEWRGLVLRNISVTAWRDLWAWVVSGIDGLTTRAALADRFADALPQDTVGTFRAKLPPTRTAAGRPAPAEIDADLKATNDSQYNLSLLMLGAQRARELSGHERHGFQGHDPEDIFEELAPAWLAGQLDAWNDRSVHDFASWLTDVMLNRSQRLALRKARPDLKKGILKIPTRVYLRDGFVFCDSAETGGPASLRLGQLAGVLAGMGLLAGEAGTWALGPRGDLLA
jgi:hypothetical protein